MKHLIKALFLIFIFVTASCGNKEEKVEKEQTQIGQRDIPAEIVETPVSTEPASTRIDLTNKGIGPVKSVALAATIDQAMVLKGLEIYKVKCMACHKPDKKFIGPAPIGILERRTPEWIMNMILSPEEMLKSDPLAKALLVEFNGSPMADQDLTEAEARSILEYFRTLK